LVANDGCDTGHVGIMMREWLTPLSQHAAYNLATDTLVQLDFRPVSLGKAEIPRRDRNHVLPSFPFSIKLQRQGAKFTGFLSLPNGDWTPDFEVEMQSFSERYFAGIFIGGAGCSARVSDVTLAPL